MPKAKTKFGYTTPMDVAPELAEDFKQTISNIVAVETKITEIFLEEIMIILHRYQLRKRVITSLPDGMPTNAQKRMNAESIRRNVCELIEQLSGEAGGIRNYLNNGIAWYCAGRQQYQNTKTLLGHLQGVKHGCDDFLDQVCDDLDFTRLPQVENRSYIDTCSPLNYLAYEVARIIKEVLQEPPNAYMYEGDNRTSQVDGKYARLLVACFDEVEHGVQHDIRTLMKNALKNF